MKDPVEKRQAIAQSIERRGGGGAADIILTQHTVKFIVQSIIYKYYNSGYFKF